MRVGRVVGVLRANGLNRQRQERYRKRDRSEPDQAGSETAICARWSGTTGSSGG